MSYSELNAETREIAERILTRKQLDVFKLWCAGAGGARIAIMLDISEPVARATLKRAQQLIKLSMEGHNVVRGKGVVKRKEDAA